MCLLNSLALAAALLRLRNVSGQVRQQGLITVLAAQAHHLYLSWEQWPSVCFLGKLQLLDILNGKRPN